MKTNPMQQTTRKPLYNKTRRVALYLILSAMQGTGYMEGASGNEHGFDIGAYER